MSKSTFWIFLSLAFFYSCWNDEKRIYQETNEGYYQGDYPLISKQGVFVFIPDETLLRNFDSYKGKLWIDIDTLSKLVSTFKPSEEEAIIEIQNPEDLFVIRSQNDSSSSDLYIKGGKRIYAFIPVNKEEFEGKMLIHKPGEISLSTFPDSFMRMHDHLKNINLPGATEDELERVLLGNRSDDDKKQVAEFRTKQNSLSELTDFLTASWERGGRRYKKNARQHLDEGDIPEKVSYYALAMNYLRDPPTDSALLRTFRKSLGEDAFVIMDWTGSMYQFREELLHFLREDIKKRNIKYLTFYNDLNCNIPGTTAGNFEGVYTHTSPFPNEYAMEKLMNTCESDGFGGGELAENDLEALEKSLSKVPDDSYKEIALIVDNNAPPKDIILLKRLKIPPNVRVKVFVCRASSEADVHPRYKIVNEHLGGEIVVVKSK